MLKYLEAAYPLKPRSYASMLRFITIPTLGLATICREQNIDNKQVDWKQTKIILPKEASSKWKNLLDDTNGSAENRELKIADIFGPQPFALLKTGQKQTERKAGILMHITSLPSAFGIGDLGPEAKKFAQFLYNSGQRVWQMLPLNPTEAEQNYSPYSSVSGIAGNTLLISPELLQKEGLLSKKELKKLQLPGTGKVDFAEAKQVKDLLFERAYENFCNGGFEQLEQEFSHFITTQSFWLDDFALYSALKNRLHKAWFEWPNEYKNRDADALQKFTSANQNLVRKEKWLQFVFFRQWLALQNYCHKRSIELLGDLPFYISYDSVDVWANPQLFSLDKNSNMIGVAGVPPDYFNAEGQLWGMPVFRWEELKKTNYQWWLQRIRKNLELFDVLRLDHFRAFADYWEVPFAEKTAINGEWKAGPGADFFNTIKKEIGSLPFVAEDLGEISPEVYQLRDQFDLPGMKVLQFAFGEDMAQSIHIPHNYPQNCYAYTGTHDNNTLLGWFENDADAQNLKRLKQYSGKKNSAESINYTMIRLIYASVAKTVIVPMQDILEEDERARMNTPASTKLNWTWRMLSVKPDKKLQKKLKKMVLFYNRA